MRFSRADINALLLVAPWLSLNFGLCLIDDERARVLTRERAREKKRKAGGRGDRNGKRDYKGEGAKGERENGSWNAS